MTDPDSSTTYFDQAYRDYGAQNPNRKLDHYLDVVVARSGPGPKNLLDVGCGLGAFLARTNERYPDWTLSGSDIEPSAIVATASRLPEARVVRAGGDEVSFPDGSFDVITAWDVVEHVPSRDAVAKSVTKMLKPNGLFAFVVPVYDGVTGPIIRRLDKDPTHVHKDPRDVWLDWARRNLENIEWHGVARYLVGRTYLHFTTHRFRRHTPAILVTGFRR